VEPHSLIPCIGASAGISALFGWYVVTLPKTRLAFVFPSWRGTADSLGWWSFRWFRVRVSVLWVFAIWFLIEWMLLGAWDGVAHEAHVGGALAGLAWGTIERLRRAGTPATP
jgi:membrane associated rhomboid family serine protease